MFLVVLKSLLDDPTIFGLATRSFYFQTEPSEIWLYHHEGANSFSVRMLQRGEVLDASIIFFADMVYGSPKEHAGICLIFASISRSSYREVTKNGWQKMIPTWSADEQAVYFNSPQFQSEYGKEVAQRA